jgi:formylglycine-generating enzyme required for sulfatase activity
MGSVYLARDSQLDRLVALKVPRFGGETVAPGDLKRFFREARAAAALSHPNLCPIFDVGEVDGTPYLTMAYLEGRLLSHLIEAGKTIEQRQVALLVRKLALAVQEAHSKGVIHRDLKPSNVMINWRSEPVIMDFGLARRDHVAESRLTKIGTLLGTPAYMAPEQVQGDPGAIGPACDIFSLGVIFYELLTGRLPFEGPAVSILGRLLTENPPPPSKYRNDLDPALEAICLKAMAKKPEERYASMADLAAALLQHLRATQQTPRTAAGVEAPDEPDEGAARHVAATVAANPSVGFNTQFPLAAETLAAEPAAGREREGTPRWMGPAPAGKPPVDRRWLYAGGGAALGVLVLLLGYAIRRPNSSPSVPVPVAEKSQRTASVPPVSSPAEREIHTTRTGQITLKRIPAGTFLMGSRSSEGRDEEHPQHEVHINRAFYLGVFEVTQAQHIAVMDGNPSAFAATGGRKEVVGDQSTSDYPVENVSWLDAVRFCNALSQREGVAPFYKIDGDLVHVPDWSGAGYRLPTEAEWEYACRAGTTTTYSFGDDEKALADYAWYGNPDGSTHPVGQKQPNAWGLYDTHGNVWEWCWDSYSAAYPNQSPIEDPHGPDSSRRGLARMYRGGSWFHGPRLARSAARSRTLAGRREFFVGFRIACNQVNRPAG